MAKRKHSKKQVKDKGKSETKSEPKQVKAKVVLTDEDKKQEQVRPATFADMIGQERLRENFADLVAGVKNSNRVLGHVLMEGLPGTGKTTLGKILAHELGVNIIYVTGTSFQQESDIVPILEELKRGDILFIDEIHKLRPRLSTFLYPVMEDFHYSYTKWVKGEQIFDEGDLPHFCLIGATTEKGSLAKPFVDRFKNTDRTDNYTLKEILQIVMRSSKIWKISIDSDAALEISKRCKFNPRLANNLLERVQIYAANRKITPISLATAQEGCRLKGVDKIGLDSLDNDYLNYLVKVGGGPAGVDNIGIAIGEKRNNLENNVEPYLIRIDFLVKTNRGRSLTQKALNYLGVKLNPKEQAKFKAAGGLAYSQEPTKLALSLKDLKKQNLAKKPG